MGLTFYYAPKSTASMTDVVLEELGVPCERVKLDIAKGDTRKADFLALNPNGKVPVIVHDGTPIWESAAITMYLGEVFGVERKLYPEAGPRRGEAMKWIVWANVTLGDAVNRWGRNTMEWAPADQRHPRAGEAAREEISACLKILDGALARRSFLAGDYSLADTHLNSYVGWLRMMKVDLAPYKGIVAWTERCSARPAFARVMARMGA